MGGETCPKKKIERINGSIKKIGAGVPVFRIRIRVGAKKKQKREPDTLRATHFPRNGKPLKGSYRIHLERLAIGLVPLEINVKA